MIYSSRCKMSIQEVPGKGRGVFTSGHLPAFIILERCPVLVIPAEEWVKFPRRGLLDAYVFSWETSGSENRIYRHDGAVGIALGFASLINHSETPNASFLVDQEAGVVDVRTLREIEAGEEVVMDYRMCPLPWEVSPY